MSAFLTSLRGFWADFGPWITVALIPTIISGLSMSPRTIPAAQFIQRVWDLVKQALSYVSFASFKNQPGTFQLPIVGGIKTATKLKVERTRLKSLHQDIDKLGGEKDSSPLIPPGGPAVLMLLVVALVNQGCCTWTGTCTDKVGKIGTEVVDCGQAAISTTILNLIPTVLAIVTGGAPNWSNQLDALSGVGKDALGCALAVVMRQIQDAFLAPKATVNEEDLKSRAKAELDIQKGRTYLQQKGIKPINVTEK